jgi:hypothetical protein
MTNDIVVICDIVISTEWQRDGYGAVAGVVGIEGGVVSEVINPESSSVGAPDRRPRHEQQYHED